MTTLDYTISRVSRIIAAGEMAKGKTPSYVNACGEATVCEQGPDNEDA